MSCCQDVVRLTPQLPPLEEAKWPNERLQHQIRRQAGRRRIHSLVGREAECHINGAIVSPLLWLRRILNYSSDGSLAKVDFAQRQHQQQHKRQLKLQKHIKQLEESRGLMLRLVFSVQGVPLRLVCRTAHKQVQNSAFALHSKLNLPPS